jgi:hypothetical protein
MSMVAAVASLLVLASALPAMGAIRTGDAVTKTKDLVIAKGTTAGGKVACPSGHKAMAGGARWLPDGFATGTRLVGVRWLAASLPTNNGTRWYVNAANMDMAVDAATLRIVVTCLPASVVGTTSSVTTFVSPSGSTGAVKTIASCGSGRRVVSGGVAWQVPGQGLDHALAEHHVLSSSAPRVSGGGWFGAGQKSAPSGAQLKVVAICRTATAVGAYTTKVSKIQPQNFPPLGVLAGGSTTCPGGTRAVTGGAFWQNPFTDEILADGVLGASVPEGKPGWYAAGAPSNNGVDRVLVLVLHCRPV